MCPWCEQPTELHKTSFAINVAAFIWTYLLCHYFEYPVTPLHKCIYVIYIYCQHAMPMPTFCHIFKLKATVWISRPSHAQQMMGIILVFGVHEILAQQLFLKLMCSQLIGLVNTFMIMHDLGRMTQIGRNYLLYTCTWQ